MQQGACYKVLVTQQQQPQPIQTGFQPQGGYLYSQNASQDTLSSAQTSQSSQSSQNSQHSSSSQTGQGGYTTTTTTTYTTTTGGSGASSFNPSPCLHFNNQGQCIACAIGFSLSDGVCIQTN